MKQLKLTSLSIAIATGLMLSGCGSDSDSTPKTAMVSFAVADAPVDDAQEVVVAIDAIELVKDGQDNLILDVSGENDLDYMQVDLKQFQGGDSALLLGDQELTIGEYKELILHVLDESEGPDFSYVTELSGAQIPMKQPSQKLKLGGFEVTSDGVQRFTIHFDLRTALVSNKNNQRYNLKPHGVEIVDNSTVASLYGTVDASLITSCVGDENEGSFVYLYPGVDMTNEQLTDNFDPAINVNPLPEGAVRPVNSTVVEMKDGSNDYSYAFGFIPAGDYTVAFSCSAALDNPESYQGLTIPNPETQRHNVTLNNEEDLEQNFQEIE
ncbi:DUF4382 domain-containing protein [uncultured Shewanella sp.]|uniref:DUF4382 domain-containing protein n=1 Tax=uncultured Shewanella sp. TaxID=173975 RepID=UPI002629D0DA|nr:DUF4382 domain-containing protein [uncultured Shewanella sp.]